MVDGKPMAPGHRKSQKGRSPADLTHTVALQPFFFELPRHGPAPRNITTWGDVREFPLSEGNPARRESM